MPTWTTYHPASGTPGIRTTHITCLPAPATLASMYSAGWVLLEDGRKTTAARRKELAALMKEET